MTIFSTLGKKMHRKLATCCILTALALCSCMSYDFSRRVVQQGNLLPAAKVDRLKPGMSKEDVSILMGTSLLSPTFDNDRWDYAYTWRKGGGRMEVHHLTLYFNHGTLVKIDR